MSIYKTPDPYYIVSQAAALGWICEGHDPHLIINDEDETQIELWASDGENVPTDAIYINEFNEIFK
jgi:hypothetical protein